MEITCNNSQHLGCFSNMVLMLVYQNWKREIIYASNMRDASFFVHISMCLTCKLTCFWLIYRNRMAIFHSSAALWILIKTNDKSETFLLKIISYCYKSLVIVFQLFHMCILYLITGDIESPSWWSTSSLWMTFIHHQSSFSPAILCIFLQNIKIGFEEALEVGVLP